MTVFSSFEQACVDAAQHSSAAKELAIRASEGLALLLSKQGFAKSIFFVSATTTANLLDYGGASIPYSTPYNWSGDMANGQKVTAQLFYIGSAE